MRKILVTASALAVAAASLVGCSTSGDSGSGSGGTETVRFYSNANETVNGVFSAIGNSAGLEVDLVQVSSTSAMLQRIEAEAGQNSADIVALVTPRVFENFLGEFASYQSTELDALTTGMREPDDKWTVVDIGVAAWMVNTSQAPGGVVPSTWRDLADPKWKGKILSGDPLNSGTAYFNLFSAYALLDTAAFEQLVANIVITDNTDTLYPAVSQGEYALTLGYESNIYPYVAGGQDDIEIVYPADGTNITYEAAAVIEKAQNPEAARRMLDALVSEEGQIQLLQETFRRPSRTDIDITQYSDLIPMDQLTFIDKNMDDPDERAAFEAAWAAAAEAAS